MEARKLLARQEAREVSPPVEHDAVGGIAFDMAADGGEVQNLPETPQGMIGVAGSRATVSPERAPDAASPIRSSGFVLKTGRSWLAS